MPGKPKNIEAANLYEHPINHLKDGKLLSHGSNPNITLTLGDLHGNAMKLIYFLVAYGIMEVSPENYASLAAIYQKNPKDLTDDHVEQFISILEDADFNHGTAIRLIGDLLADRGQNDLFTLLVLNKLRKQAIDYEVLLSNHDVWFIEAYETGNTFFHSQNPGQSISSAHLHCILKDDPKPLNEISEDNYHPLNITRAEILQFVEEAYKPALKALNYTLSDDQTEIIIYSHAPIGLLTVQQMAKDLSVKYQDKTAEQLAETIDAINKAFQKRVKNNTLTASKKALASSSQIDAFNEWLSSNPEQNDNNKKTFSKFSSFVVLIWNRLTNFVDRPTTHPKHGYKQQFVHGHCSSQNDPQHIINLDNNNQIGKDLKMPAGNFPVWISAKTQQHLTLTTENRNPPRAHASRSDSRVPTLPDENSGTLRHAQRKVRNPKPSTSVIFTATATTSFPTTEPVATAAVAASSQIAAVPAGLSQAVAVVLQEKNKIGTSLTVEQAQTFFQADIAAGLQALQNDILNRHWITNMGGEKLAGAATKVPKSIAKIYTAIENAKIDQNNRATTSPNWLATQTLVINLLKQSASSDHFTRDPQTYKWLETVIKVAPTVIASKRNKKSDTKITDKEIAVIFNLIKKTQLTGGQTILIENRNGAIRKKKVPRTFEEIYTVIQNAWKDKNGNLILEPNWEVSQQQILEIAKISAENRTRFRVDETQQVIVGITNRLTPNLKSIEAELESIKINILKTTEHKSDYRVGFFSKNIRNEQGQKITVSWKEKVILELIKQTKNNLLPAISCAEQIKQILTASKNLAFLTSNNDALMQATKPFDVPHQPTCRA